MRWERVGRRSITKMNDVEKFIENIEKVSIADSSGYVLVP